MTSNNWRTQRLKTVADNKNTKQLVVRIFSGILLVILPILFLIRIPYLGEFFDGVLFDLLLFGTAKYFVYLYLIVVAIFFLLLKKPYWKLFISKRWIYSSWIVFGLLALIFAIVNYFKDWFPNRNNIDIQEYLNNFFVSWRTRTWVNGTLVWQRDVLINGSLWWTLAVAINAQVPILLFFVLAFLLTIIIVLIVGLKLKWKKIIAFKERMIVWFGGFVKNSGPNKVANTHHFINPYTMKIDDSTPIFENNDMTDINYSLDSEHSLVQSHEHVSTSHEIAPVATPYSLQDHIFSNVVYGLQYDDIFIDNREKNEAFAHEGMQNLTDFFIVRSIHATPKNFHCGPSMISMYYELSDPNVVKEFATYKNEMQSVLKVKQLDVYLKGNSLEIQIPVAYSNQISFKQVNETIFGANRLVAAIGKTHQNQICTVDLAENAVVLLTGILGSGKRMMLTSIVLSLVTNFSAKQIMLVIIDTRSSHLSRFVNAPHLVADVANTVSDAFTLFEEVLLELKYRAQLLREYEVTTINEYNQLKTTVERIKPLILVINDFGDMLEDDQEYVLKFLNTIHGYAQRLSVSLILSVSQINELVYNEQSKKNYDQIYAFKAESSEESQLLLNKNHLVKLYGKGDFIMLNHKNHQTVRGLSCYVDNSQLNKILENLQKPNENFY